MSKMLLIVDPQIDFISGTLPVDGAAEAMDALAGYITDRAGKYAATVITADCHPYDHCSFRRNGGEWPDHCIHDTTGAALWPRVFDAAYGADSGTEVVHKGQRSDADEYSVFRNEAATRRIGEIIREKAIGEIDVCGLAGDVCVLESVKDGRRMFPQCRFRVLEEYSPSIDGGKALKEYLKT